MQNKSRKTKVEDVEPRILSKTEAYALPYVKRHPRLRELIENDLYRVCQLEDGSYFAEECGEYEEEEDYEEEDFIESLAEVGPKKSFADDLCTLETATNGSEICCKKVAAQNEALLMNISKISEEIPAEIPKKEIQDDLGEKLLSEQNDGSNINPKLTKILEIQVSTVSYVNQNEINAIGKVDNLLNYLIDNQSNSVSLIQKATGAIQLNQVNSKEIQPLKEKRKIGRKKRKKKKEELFISNWKSLGVPIGYRRKKKKKMKNQEDLIFTEKLKDYLKKKKRRGEMFKGVEFVDALMKWMYNKWKKKEFQPNNAVLTGEKIRIEAVEVQFIKLVQDLEMMKLEDVFASCLSGRTEELVQFNDTRCFLDSGKQEEFDTAKKGG
jgi:hypothetical protein